MTTFSWLHFTDLHWGSSQTENYWGRVAEGLFKDIEYLKNNYDLSFDAIFFTGDLVNRGSEYEQFNNEWLDRLEKEFSRMKLKPMLLTVPGNHDLVRPGEADNSYKAIRNEWDKNAKIRNRIWEKEVNTGTWKLVQAAFKNYTDWRNDPERVMPRPADLKEGLLPGDFAYTFNKDQCSIGIVGLNTAFLHLSDDSEGRLDLHPSQMVELCGIYHNDWIEKHDACFIMTHLPRSWLSKRGKEAFEKEIAPEGRFLLHLCGHLHENEYEESRKGFHSESRKTLQSISLFSKENYIYLYDGVRKEITDRRHGYSAGQLICEPGRLQMRIWPRTVNKNLEFVVDTNLCKKCEYVEIEIKRERGGNGRAVVDIETKEIVKEKIKKLLDQNVLDDFCMYILETEKEQNENVNAVTKAEIPGLLVEKKLRDSIALLNLSIKKCGEWLKNTRLNTGLIHDVWGEVEKIVGWLVLLTVNSEWRIKNRNILENDNHMINMEISVKTELGIEIAVSGIEKKPAEFSLDKSGKVRSTKKLGDKGCLETGLDQTDRLIAIKSEIYKALFNESPPSPYSEREDKKLNALLDIRNRQREHHYIAIKKEHIDGWSGNYKKLKEDLPALNIVVLNIAGNENVILIDEEALYSYLWEFLQHKPR